MSLLAPFGLLGLLGIVALILIYVLKPNYQQKAVSSTYVWKLSLKYKKKRIPINRFRNILIFICQILILVLSAILLASPFVLAERMERPDDRIVILDASASMLVSDGEETRFERAVSQIKDLAASIDGNQRLSVIVADENAHFVLQRSAANDLIDVTQTLDELLLPPEEDSNGAPVGCSFGSADVEGAFSLAEEMLVSNPEAQVSFYTATTYIDEGRATVVNVAAEDEWNVAVLNVTAAMNDDNFYEFTVDVGCYGRSEEVTVYCEIYGVNGDSPDARSLCVQETVQFSNLQEEFTVRFTADKLQEVVTGEGVYAYDHVRVYVEEVDSLDEDNTFYLYGGTKEKLRVLYASSRLNPYFSTSLLVLRESEEWGSYWDIELKEVNTENLDSFQEEGYDFYIFEHKMPRQMPTDGIVMLVDPETAPNGAGFTVASDPIEVDVDTRLAAGTRHAVTEYIDANKITVSKYARITSQTGYEELMYQSGDPALLVKDDDLSKVIVLALDLNYSNLGILPEFPMMMLNIVNYFLPITVTSHTFEVGQSVSLNARAPLLKLSGPDLQEEYDVFPKNITISRPGTYTLSQRPVTSTADIIENFFVHIPNLESNITKEVDALPFLSVGAPQDYDDLDLLIYFASALVALLFVEWLLQSREYFR